MLSRWLHALTAASMPVTRINPRRARAFADAMGKVVKTDPIDAAPLARMAMMVRSPCLPLDPQRAALRDLVQRREQFVHLRDHGQRRLQQARSDGKAAGSRREAQ